MINFWKFPRSCLSSMFIDVAICWPTQAKLKSDVETWASANRVSVGNLLSGKTEDFLREVGYRLVFLNDHFVLIFCHSCVLRFCVIVLVVVIGDTCWWVLFFSVPVLFLGYVIFVLLFYLLVLTVVVGCQSVLFRRDLHPAVLAMGVDYWFVLHWGCCCFQVTHELFGPTIICWSQVSVSIVCW